LKKWAVEELQLLPEQIKIPEFTKDLTVRARPDSLEYCLQNLLTNASEARDPQKTSLLIELGCQSLEDRVSVTVKDNGKGMTEEQLKNYRAGRTFSSKPARGTGWGLTVLFRIAEVQGGSVELDSKQGVGTTITISIPQKSFHD
jgi:signal transduction histidine kinase